jgi:hypothetical protein
MRKKGEGGGWLCELLWIVFLMIKNVFRGVFTIKIDAHDFLTEVEKTRDVGSIAILT